MTGVLAVMLASALGLTYATLRRSARDVALSRLQGATQQLGSLAQSAVVQVKARLSTAAGDSALRSALATTAGRNSTSNAISASAARATLTRLLPPGDSTSTIELWTEDGRRIASAGRDLGAVRVRERESATARGPVPREGLESLHPSDSVQVSAIYADGDSMYFWVVAPVIAGGVRRGYLARQYLMADGPRADETVRALTGADVRAYYRNVDGSLWMTLSGNAATAPAQRDSSARGVVVSRAGVGELLTVERRIAGSPFILALEMPLRSVLAEPRATLGTLALLSFLLLVAGAAAAWLVSRRITRPLASLTGAAQAIADGDYGTRVVPKGDDELVRLATSFNHMANEIGASRQELEMQTDEAQAIAEELEQSNSELGTALAEVEERESQFRALADAIPQLAWMAHADGTIFWYNERWYAYTGTTLDDSQGWGWQSVHDPATLPAVLERWRGSIASGEPFEMEFPLRGADGRFRWFLTRVRPVRDREGTIVRWFGTNTDVQALRDAREAAERARLQAEAANRAKTEFLTVMSHELRTPLNAIAGYTELIELGIRGPVTESQRHDLERIRVNQQYLLGLISGVLDLSRIESGRVAYDLAPILLDPFLAEIDNLVAPQAAAKSLRLEYLPCAPGLATLSDGEKLRQILLNLISNAIRYTAPGGRIVLAAEARSETTVAITTHDTGIGIAPEALARIFEPFVQLDRSLTHVREGVGLGLSISRDLARGMRGELSVESVLGQGSAFTIVLPRAHLEDEVSGPLVHHTHADAVLD